MRTVAIVAVILLALLFAGCEKKEETGNIVVSSPAFENLGKIPVKYTCNGIDTSPPLNFSCIPENAESLALVMYDTDAPNGIFYHWTVWNIPADSTSLPEGDIPYPQGTNDFGVIGYRGPCPPYGVHHYHFKVYALDTTLSLENGATLNELNEALSGHILDTGELIGIYGK